MSSTQPLAVPRRWRRDLQGLRAAAVLAVIAHHVWGYPVGGFLGVDVFFVLSGFLVTDTLLRDRIPHGGMGVASFYRHRARRVVPAALLVIGTTTAASYYFFSAARARTVTVDGIWSALFASNWRVTDNGIDHRVDALDSPLQHYWSLAVLVQLYLIWPWLVLFVLGRAPGQHQRRFLLGTVAVIVAASFAYSTWHATSAVSTLDRVWEFGVGALVASARPALEHLPSPVRLAGGWVGLGLLVTSVLAVSGDSTSRTAWGVAAVVGTAVVIASGVAAEQRALFPLVNPVATFIGDISYSLYLWHFPAMVLLLVDFPDAGWRYSLVVLVVTGAAAVLSHKAVEDPVRRSQWLEPGFRDRLDRPRRKGIESPPGLAQSWAVAVTCVVLAVTIAYWRGPDPLPDAPHPLDAVGATPTAGPVAERRQRRVVGSLKATDFPVLEPGLRDLGVARWAQEIDERVCFDVSESNAADCVFGDEDAPRAAVVLGDAFGAAWMGAVLAALPADRYQVHQITNPQCPAWDVSMAKGAAYRACAGFRRWAFREVERIQPDLLILSSYHYRGYEIAGVDSTDAVIAEEVRIGLARTLAKTDSARSTVVLAPPPGSANLQECAIGAASPEDCVRELPAIWNAVSFAESSAAATSGAFYVNTSGWFCFAGLCPAFIGSTPATVDGAHIPWRLSTGLGPALREALRVSGAVPVATLR